MHTSRARLIRRAGDLPRRAPAKGRRVLLLLSRRGSATHEALTPLFQLEAAGATVVVGSDESGAVELDPVCNILAGAERLWSPVYGYLQRSRARGLTAQAIAPVDLDGIDAVVVPGGHGRAFGAFVQSAFVRDVLHRSAANGAVIGIQCHAVIATALPGPHGEVPLAANHEVTCWPKTLEWLASVPPIVGSYMRPLGPLVENLVRPVAGRLHTDFWPWRMPHVVIDGALVTSWGPWSVDLFTDAVLTRIEELHAD